MLYRFNVLYYYVSLICWISACIGDDKIKTSDSDKSIIAPYNIPIDYDGFYSINLTLGNQKFDSVILNTAESMLMLFDADNYTRCGDKTNLDKCVPGNTFKPSRVTTPNPFQLDFFDGNAISGRWDANNLTYNTTSKSSKTVPSFNFGIIENSTFMFPGQLGIGRGTGGTSLMAAVLSTMNSSVYSLYLTSPKSASILLGAIDPTYFKRLYIYDLIPVTSNLNSNQRSVDPMMFIILENISVAKDAGSLSTLENSLYIPVLLDSGNLFSYLPFDTVVNIAVQVGATYHEDLHIWTQTCDYRDLSGLIYLSFAGDVQIEVPVRSLLIPIYDENGEPIHETSGKSLCMLSFLDSQPLGYNSLGMNVLRQMYLAVDISNNQVGIAPLKRELVSATSLQTTTTTTTQSANISTIDALTNYNNASYITASAPVQITISAPASNFTDLGNRFPTLRIQNISRMTASMDVPSITEQPKTSSVSLIGSGAYRNDASRTMFLSAWFSALLLSYI